MLPASAAATNHHGTCRCHGCFCRCHTSIKGIVVAEVGAGALVNYTVTITATAGTLSATGTGVTQSGTASLKIGPSTLPVVTAALATLTYTGQNDTITVAVTDSLSQTATPATIQVQTIIGTYQYIDLLNASGRARALAGSSARPSSATALRRSIGGV